MALDLQVVKLVTVVAAVVVDAGAVVVGGFISVGVIFGHRLVPKKSPQVFLHWTRTAPLVQAPVTPPNRPNKAGHPDKSVQSGPGVDVVIVVGVAVVLWGVVVVVGGPQMPHAFGH